MSFTTTLSKTAIALTLIAASVPQLGYSQTFDFAHIETTGRSEISVPADLATVSFEIAVQEDNAKKAKASSDKAVSQFLARLDQFDIAKQDISSANLNLRPQYQYEKNQPRKLNGYQASRLITVTVRQLDLLNDILDSALDDGINHVNNIQLGTSQFDEYVAKARSAAMKDAKAKAEALAIGFDKNIDTVWKINYDMASHDYRPVYKMTADAEMGGQGYEQGQITVTDSVNVVFKLK